MDKRQILLERVGTIPEWHPDVFDDNPFDGPEGDAETSEVADDAGNPPPPIPEDIYDDLPPKLYRLTRFFAEGHERAVFLVSLLVVLSSAFSRVRLRYSRKWQGLNLYAVIVAPPASGKSTMQKALEVGDRIDERLIEESRQALEEWQLGGGTGESPPRLRFYLAADSSLAAVVEGLAENEGTGLIYSSEIASMVNAQRQEWGQYRDVVLKGWHSEPILQDRKGRSIRIKEPSPGLLLSGTEPSAIRLLTPIEDGFFSRCLSYSLQVPPVFTSQFGNEHDEELDARLREYAKLADDVYKALADRGGRMVLSFEPEQQDVINGAFSQAFYQLVSAGVDQQLLANVKRHALAACRIAGTIALCRRVESGEPLAADTLPATDEDVRAGVRIVQALLPHALYLASRLLNVQPELTDKEREFFEHLPTGSFSTSEAEEVGEGISISRTTVFRYLKKLVRQSRLVRDKQGKYNKSGPMNATATGAAQGREAHAHKSTHQLHHQGIEESDTYETLRQRDFDTDGTMDDAEISEAGANGLKVSESQSLTVSTSRTSSPEDTSGAGTHAADDGDTISGDRFPTGPDYEVF